MKDKPHDELFRSQPAPVRKLMDDARKLKRDRERAEFMPPKDLKVAAIVIAAFFIGVIGLALFLP